MADIIYLTLNGNKQGLISAGCSSYDSIGNRYQNNHSDENLVYSTDYDISRHQNISHAPFVFEKADDKSSALLLSSITNLDTPIYIRSPWELKKQLLDIYFPERGGIISGAY